MLTRLRAHAVCAIAAVLAVGCVTGRDAVAQGGTFEFVSPDGETDLFYDPSDNRRQRW